MNFKYAILLFVLGIPETYETMQNWFDHFKFSSFYCFYRSPFRFKNCDRNTSECYKSGTSI